MSGGYFFSDFDFISSYTYFSLCFTLYFARYMQSRGGLLLGTSTVVTSYLGDAHQLNSILVMIMIITIFCLFEH